MIDYISVVYNETEIELWRPIWPNIVYDKNQRGEWRDRLYKSDLRKKQY